MCTYRLRQRASIATVGIHDLDRVTLERDRVLEDHDGPVGSVLGEPCIFSQGVMTPGRPLVGVGLDRRDRDHDPGEDRCRNRDTPIHLFRVVRRCR